MACEYTWDPPFAARDLWNVRRNRALRERQRWSERHRRLHPFTAARHVQPHEQMRFRVHTNTDAVVFSQPVHRQRRDRRRDRSGVVENRAVERASEAPAVLRVYQEQIAIAEAVVQIPAEAMRSAKRWQEIERYLLARTGLRHVHAASDRGDRMLCDRHVVRRFDLQAPEAVA